LSIQVQQFIIENKISLAKSDLSVANLYGKGSLRISELVHIPNTRNVSWCVSNNSLKRHDSASIGVIKQESIDVDLKEKDSI